MIPVETSVGSLAWRQLVSRLFEEGMKQGISLRRGHIAIHHQIMDDAIAAPLKTRHYHSKESPREARFWGG